MNKKIVNAAIEMLQEEKLNGVVIVFDRQSFELIAAGLGDPPLVAASMAMAYTNEPGFKELINEMNRAIELYKNLGGE